MPSENTDYHFLQDGGEMGHLIRTKDWSQTPLGDPDSWPRSLKQTVRIMLDNPFGMCVAWGKEQTQIYNDAFRQILGTNKHPEALGEGTMDTFSEVWEIFGPMYDDVTNGKAVSHSDFKSTINRNGYPEDCYFDFSYSPIRLDSGDIAGVLTTVIETTSNHQALAEIEESNDELEFVIESAQLGTFDYNPMTDRFSGNTRMRNWFGLPLNGEIELTDAINVIAEHDRDRIVKAIEEALKYESGGDYNVKFTIVNAITNKVTHVHTKGRTWFNGDKVAYRFTGTLEDITEQTIANSKTRETQNHIRTMILESPVGICLLDADTLICETANESFVKMAGKPREQIIGNSYWDNFAEVKTEYFDVLDTVIKTGEPFSANEVGITLSRNQKEEKVYVSFVYAPLKDENDKVVKV
ncbi:MAG: PAS domain-containing protein, partial [Maribacter sp.]